MVGIGHIGTRVAALARAFGMEVIATDPFLSNEEIARRGAKAVSFEELLAESDFVSLHCPRDASTLKLMNADDLRSHEARRDLHHDRARRHP